MSSWKRHREYQAECRRWLGQATILGEGQLFKKTLNPNPLNPASLNPKLVSVEIHMDLVISLGPSVCTASSTPVIRRSTFGYLA